MVSRIFTKFSVFSIHFSLKSKEQKVNNLFCIKEAIAPDIRIVSCAYERLCF